MLMPLLDVWSPAETEDGLLARMRADLAHTLFRRFESIDLDSAIERLQLSDQPHLYLLDRSYMRIRRFNSAEHRPSAAMVDVVFALAQSAQSPTSDVSGLEGVDDRGCDLTTARAASAGPATVASGSDTGTSDGPGSALTLIESQSWRVAAWSTIEAIGLAARLALLGC